MIRPKRSKVVREDVIKLPMGKLRMMNIHSSLVGELTDKQYRDAFVTSQLEIALPMQIRALRKSRRLTQPQLAEKAGMAQPRISEIEKPGGHRLNVETLLRLASAFDVGLQIRFVPFSDLIEWSESCDLHNFSIPEFSEELNDARSRQQRVSTGYPEQDVDKFLASAGNNIVSPEVFTQYMRRVPASGVLAATSGGANANLSRSIG